MLTSSRRKIALFSHHCKMTLKRFLTVWRLVKDSTLFSMSRREKMTMMWWGRGHSGTINLTFFRSISRIRKGVKSCGLFVATLLLKRRILSCHFKPKRRSRLKWSKVCLLRNLMLLDWTRNSKTQILLPISKMISRRKVWQRIVNSVKKGLGHFN